MLSVLVGFLARLVGLWELNANHLVLCIANENLMIATLSHLPYNSCPLLSPFAPSLVSPRVMVSKGVKKHSTYQNIFWDEDQEVIAKLAVKFLNNYLRIWLRMMVIALGWLIYRGDFENYFTKDNTNLQSLPSRVEIKKCDISFKL